MRVLATALISLLIGALALPATATEKLITIGTAGELGVYYPAGGAICRLVKRGFKEHGIRCVVRSTSGSVYNLKALRAGQLDLAIAQADWVYHAYNGTREFAESGPDHSLRVLFSLHTEAFAVLVRADSDIRSIRDLAGRSIGIGNDGSGTRATSEEFIKAEGWTDASFAATHELKPSEQAQALCGGMVDAVLFTTGHPNGNTEEMTQHCHTRLIDVTGPEITRMLRDNPYYLKVTLPGGMYPGSPRPIMTFGVKALLMSSSRVTGDVIYEVVKAVFDNLDNFKTLHPVFSVLDKTRMATEGLLAPLHNGARRYYREAGIIK